MFPGRAQLAGVRAEYRKAAFAWHQSAKGAGELYLARGPERRAFKAPADILR